jgi:hypothetical protein
MSFAPPKNIHPILYREGYTCLPQEDIILNKKRTQIAQ